MGKLAIVSAKVDKELKKRAQQLVINISELVRKALEKRRLSVWSFRAC